MGTINQITFGGSDEAALEYIRKRGYASYSSMTNVRDKRIPEPFKETIYYRFGKELHSRFLERKKLVTLTLEEEMVLKAGVHNLAEDPIVARLMDGAMCEIDFDTKVNKLRVFGRIDILNFAVADLKTTSCTSKIAFVNSMDFLQAALYTRATGRKDFYYVGVCKLSPYNIMVFNVNQFPERFTAANAQLDYLTKYIYKKLNEKSK